MKTFNLLLILSFLLPSVTFGQETVNFRDYREEQLKVYYYQEERLKVISKVAPIMTREDTAIIAELTSKTESIDFSEEIKVLNKNPPKWIEIGTDNNYRNVSELMKGVCGLLPQQVQSAVTYKILKLNGMDDLSTNLDAKDVMAVPDCKALAAKVKLAIE